MTPALVRSSATSAVTPAISVSTSSADGERGREREREDGEDARARVHAGLPSSSGRAVLVPAGPPCQRLPGVAASGGRSASTICWISSAAADGLRQVGHQRAGARRRPSPSARPRTPARDLRSRRAGAAPGAARSLRHPRPQRCTAASSRCCAARHRRSRRRISPAAVAVAARGAARAGAGRGRVERHRPSSDVAGARRAGNRALRGSRPPRAAPSRCAGPRCPGGTSGQPAASDRGSARRSRGAGPGSARAARRSGPARRASSPAWSPCRAARAPPLRLQATYTETSCTRLERRAPRAAPRRQVAQRAERVQPPSRRDARRARGEISRRRSAAAPFRSPRFRRRNCSASAWRRPRPARTPRAGILGVAPRLRRPGHVDQPLAATSTSVSNCARVRRVSRRRSMRRSWRGSRPAAGRGPSRPVAVPGKWREYRARAAEAPDRSRATSSRRPLAQRSRFSW